MVTLPEPTPALIQEGIDQFDRQGEVTEAAISRLLASFPLNTDHSAVLLKVIVINRVYSTNIYAVQPVTEMIVQANIDELLCEGDSAAVEAIRRVEFTDQAGVFRQRNIYSFATKYCTLHNPENYAMYDGLVAQKLWEYQKQWRKERKESFCDRFEWEDLKDFSTFKAIVTAFRKHFGLEEYALRDVDKFLWTLGKGNQ